ncbi:hypothetical protein OROMI_026624 [Orobanche minor]
MIPSSAADKQPMLPWNVGLNGEDLPPSRSVKSEGGGEGNGFDRAKFIVSGALVDKVDLLGGNANLVGPSRSFRRPEVGASGGDRGGTESISILEGEGGVKDDIPKKANCTDNVDEDLCRPQNIEIDGFADVSRKDAGLNTSADGISDCKGDKTINRLFLTEPIRKTLCNHNTDIEEINTRSKEKTDFGVAIIEPVTIKHSSLKKIDDGVTSSSKEINKNKTNTPLSIPAPPSKKLESSAESVTLCRGKGKGKAFSDGDVSNSEDDSHGSVESCSNNAGLFSKSIKRRCDDDRKLIFGSKRTKRQMTDSSFAKWLSNIMKGPPGGTIKEDCSSLAPTHTRVGVRDDSVTSNTGFRTIFQSLYRRNTYMSCIGVQKENDNSCKQIVVSDKEVYPLIGQTSDRLENKDGLIPFDSVSKQMNSNEEKPKTEKETHLNSLWITRFSTGTPGLGKSGHEFTLETKKCSTNFPKVGLDRSPATGVFPTDKKSCEKLKSSEATASFLSKSRNSPTCSIKCFFCGRGHDLCKCPDVRESELEDLVLKTSSFGNAEGLFCLCIRCFQIDHWAVSCPLAPSSGNLRTKEQNGPFTNLYSASCTKHSDGQRVSTSNDIKQFNASYLVKEVLNYHKRFPLCNRVTAKDEVEQLEMFHAIRNLRVSRSGIFRWMDSNVALSYLNGFFLRLRLGKKGKVEEGGGATTYYVARITGQDLTKKVVAGISYSLSS